MVWKKRRQGSSGSGRGGGEGELRLNKYHRTSEYVENLQECTTVTSGESWARFGRGFARDDFVPSQLIVAIENVGTVLFHWL